MPRVAGIYARPTGIDAVANNTIDSGKYNSNVADVEADLNLPRPIVAGGTGATNAFDARKNIGAEVSSLSQVVTNYDTQVFESGSFASFIGATGAPTGTEHFSGVSTLLTADNNFVTLRAVGNATGDTYTRRKESGIWGAWTSEKSRNDALYVNVTGDNMTGNLGINAANPVVALSKTASGQEAAVRGYTNGVLRWQVLLGSAQPETGGNTGSDFAITRFTDAGAVIDTPFYISRVDGKINTTAIVATTLEANAGRIMSKTLSNSSVGVWNGAADAAGIWLESGSLLVGQVTSAGVPTMSGSTAYINAKTDFFQVSSALARKPGGGAWADSSDARIKSVLGNYDNGLDAILQLQPVRYTFKGNDTADAPQQRTVLNEKAQPLPMPKDAAAVPYGNSPHYTPAVEQKEFIGLIAQAVEGPMPEMVMQSAGMIDGQPVTDLRSLDTTALTYALINSVKTLAARLDAVETLARKIEAL